MNGPLLRPRFDRKVAGVCAAFARSYGWDLNLVRLVLVLLVFFGGGGVLAYVICWIVIPEEPVGMAPYGTGYPVDPNYPPNPNYPPAQYGSSPNYPPATYPPTNPPGAPPAA